jgi:hypothetical protein
MANLELVGGGNLHHSMTQKRQAAWPTAKIDGRRSWNNFIVRIASSHPKASQ